MKLEVGMYVRTYDGKIGKAVELNNENSTFVEIECLDHWLLLHCLITKASHNIIDLIEVGDYVNGHKVLGINLNLKWWDDELGEQDELEGIKLESYGYIYPNSNYYFELKSIVTKEQFEAMAYKVV